MSNYLRFVLIAFAVIILASPAIAVPVAITNHSFQDPVIPTDANVDDEDPLDTDPGSPTGWTYSILTNPPATLSYGVQRPDPDAHIFRDISVLGQTAPFAAPFDGDQNGFINLNNDPTSAGGATTAQVDSDVLGMLAEGNYKLNFAVAARNTGSWRNLQYSIGLVGATSGPLGTPTPQLMDPGNAAGDVPLGTELTTNPFNVIDVQYMLNVPTGSPLIGENYFIRLTVDNTGQGGTGAFTQAAFDNARLDFAVPGAGQVGDYDNSGVVDAADYVKWRKNVGNPANSLDNNPLVGNIGDLHYEQWRTNFGKPPGSGASLGSNIAVPEPGTCLLAIIGLAVLISRRRYK